MAADAGGPRRWRFARAANVRFRTTTVAVAVVAAALAAGGLTLVAVMHNTLQEEVETATRLRLSQVIAEMEKGGRPSIEVVERDEQLVQILDPSGRVLAASSNMAGEPAVADLSPGHSAKVDVPVDDSTFYAVAGAAGSPGGPVTVIVAHTLEDVVDSTRLVAVSLVIGLPLLLLVVGTTTFRVVGRALAPVDAIRQEVDEISASELHRRVPDPPGTDEIARLATTMNRMLGRLERSQARQRRFISDASHELRSPVASIRQHAEVALAHPSRTTVQDLARTVLAEDLRVERLVDDLLLLARADEHTLALRRRPVDVDDLVFEEARRLRQTTGLTVSTAAVSPGRVEGDPGTLRRVLRNLADNAARHAAGRVSFTLGRGEDGVVLTVEDDGPGIPVAERERVFERFVRLDNARARDSGGSGLGLSIVAEILRAHGGSVVVGDSALGGASVRVTLPVAGAEPSPAADETGADPLEDPPAGDAARVGVDPGPETGPA
ncbi:MAG: sensor histidine kinase [Actinomycetota bacterium]